MTIADQLYDQAFTHNTTRDPRSKAYKQGVHDALRAASSQGRIKLRDLLLWELGTPEADAWFAGTDEGKRRWRNFVEND